MHHQMHYVIISLCNRLNMPLWFEDTKNKCIRIKSDVSKDL